jgi:hypothetical protein
MIALVGKREGKRQDLTLDAREVGVMRGTVLDGVPLNLEREDASSVFIELRHNFLTSTTSYAQRYLFAILEELMRLRGFFGVRSCLLLGRCRTNGCSAGVKRAKGKA